MLRRMKPMTQPQPSPASDPGTLGAAASGAGAALVATAAGACCTPLVAPLVVTVLGAGGAAWAAGLKPYAPWLLAGAFVMLAAGFRSAYRRRASCHVGSRTALRAARIVRAVLWVAAAVWLLAAAANFVGARG